MRKFNSIFYYMALANFFFFLGCSFYFLFPVFLKNMGATESYIGIMCSIDRIFSLITTIGIASFIRVKDKIRLLRIGYILLIITFASYLLISGLTWNILIIRIFHGIGFSIAFITGTTIIFDIVSLDKAAEAIGIFGVTGALSNAISPFAGEMLLSYGVSFHFIFSITIVLLVLSLCVTFIIPKLNRQSEESNPGKSGFLYLFRNAQFLFVSIGAVIFGGGFGVIITYLPNFVLATTDFKFSYFFIIYISVLVLIRFQVIGRLSELNNHNIIIFMFFTGMLTNIFLNYLNSIYIFIIISILYGLTHGILNPLLNTMMVSLVSDEERGKANAVYNGCFLGGGMIFSLVLGFLIDYSGTYLTAFKVCAAAFFIGVILMKLNSLKFSRQFSHS